MKLQTEAADSWLGVCKNLCWLAALLIFAVVAFWPFLVSRSFGPEFTEFYIFDHAKSFRQILHSYTQFNTSWYRPTQFFLPYWFADRFLDWHDARQWRAAELLTAVAVSWVIYWLVLLLKPNHRLAAFFAGAYFLTNPTLFVPLYELAGFDFLHIVFCTACVIAFVKGYRNTGWRSFSWTLLSWVLLVIALTSKELTLTTPIFLALASLILIVFEPIEGRSWKQTLRREIQRLAPFWIMPPVFWALHIRNIPPSAYTPSGDYRVAFHTSHIIHNAVKYPLWLAREFSYTGDTMEQALGYTGSIDTMIGVAILLAVLLGSLQLWRRDREFRKIALFAVAWIGVFLLLPVYSGGYFWHGNLALAGFCILFGLALEHIFTALRSRGVQVLTLLLGLSFMVAFMRADQAECLQHGIHSESYRINSTVLQYPPVPVDRITGPALVYVEDRQNLGEWFYGAGSLFNLVYFDESLKQKVVPPMNEVSHDDAEQWLQSPQAFFFQYDSNYRWHDASGQFRSIAQQKASERIFPPSIQSLGPSETHVHAPFNQQPDGSSAISVNGEHFEHGCTLVANGRSLPTAFGNSKWITATVPDDLIAHSGVITFKVKNHNGLESGPMEFRVLP